MRDESVLLLKSYILQILYQLYQDVTNPFMNTAIQVNPHYSVIMKTLEYIKTNIHKDLSLERLANQANLSPSHFHKVFSSAMNVTPNECITRLRLDKAIECFTRGNSGRGTIIFEFTI